MNELFRGIYAKFKSSTGADSLYVALDGEMYNTQAMQDATRPYAVFFLISDIPHWTFDATMENALVQFNIYDENSSVVNVGNLYEKLTSLYDWTELSSTGDYYSIYMKRESSNLAQYSEIWQYSVDYRIEFQKKEA